MTVQIRSDLVEVTQICQNLLVQTMRWNQIILLSDRSWTLGFMFIRIFNISFIFLWVGCWLICCHVVDCQKFRTQIPTFPVAQWKLVGQCDSQVACSNPSSAVVLRCSSKSWYLELKLCRCFRFLWAVRSDPDSRSQAEPNTPQPSQLFGSSFNI